MSQPDEPPTVSQVAEQLRQLLQKTVSREDVSRWASAWVTRFEKIADARIKQAIDRLSGADTPTNDRAYLYEDADFEAWLRELTTSAGSNAKST